MRAAGVDGDELNLSKQLGGDRPTVLAVVCALLGSLRVLDLSDNQLGPEGGAALAEGLEGNSMLESLKYRPLSAQTSAKACSLLCQRPLTLTACLSPWQCGRARASDRRAQGHKADREDRPLGQGAGCCLRHHHRELHQGERRAQGAQVRRRPYRVFAFVSAPLDMPSTPVLTVSRPSASTPREDSLSLRASRATPRCDPSSRPPGPRTGARVFAFVSAPADTHLPSHCPNPSLAVSAITASEMRGSPSSLPSSRRHRSPASSAPLPDSVRFCVSAR